MARSTGCGSVTPATVRLRWKGLLQTPHRRVAFHSAKGDASTWPFFAMQCLAFGLKWKVMGGLMCLAATSLFKACSGHRPKTFTGGTL